MAQRRLLGGLISWLTGGLSARLDFVERDLESLQARTGRIAKEHEALTAVVGEHHRAISDHRRRLDSQATQMIALRKMHALLSEKIGQPFPGKRCPACAGKLIFRRRHAENAYSLECEGSCGKRLLLPEAKLLASFDGVS